MMFRKNYFLFLTFAALFLLSGAMVFAQSAPVRGKVQLKKADGTTVPLEGATVDIYRTNAAGKLPVVKTDAKGMFASDVVPANENFVVVISAPTIKPELKTEIKGGQEITITVTEGNGEVPSEEDVREVLAASKIDPNSAEGKKLQAEREKKTAEFNAKNEKAKNSNEVINRTIKEGNEAFNAQNYDVAIAKFDEGYKAAPDFLGSAPVMLNNKGNALRLRGYSSYKKATTDAANKESLIASAKKDWDDAVTTYQQTIALTTAAPAADANAQKGKATALSGLVESYRLLVASRADATKTKELTAAANEYAASNADAAAKTKTLVAVGDALRTTGDSADAVPIYRKVLEIEPSNVDALGGLGLSLFDVGVSSDNKEQKQEGLNLMKKFTETAPDNHPLKNDIKGAVDYLVNTEKLAPQKVTTKKKS